jgi:hypothetical protein
MRKDPFYKPEVRDRLEMTLSKIELIASFIAKYEDGQVLSAEGIYYILDDAIMDIRELFDETQEKEETQSCIKSIKKAA